MSQGERGSDRVEPWFVKALAHPLRIGILEILNEREASPREMSEVLDAPLSVVSYHVGVLSDCGCVKETRSQAKRGAVEHFYLAIPRSFVGHQDLRDVPRSVRNTATGMSLNAFLRESYAAIKAGKVDDRDDTLWSCMHLAVDEAGWQRAIEIGKEALASLEEVAEQSLQRAKGAENLLVPIVVAIAVFEAITGQGTGA